MAATAGTLILAGRQTGINRQVDLYLDDVANARVNFDGGVGASATSEEFFRPDEDSVIVDAPIVTGAAQTRLQVIINGKPTGDILRHVVQVDTSVGRPLLNIPIAAQATLTIIQLA